MGPHWGSGGNIASLPSPCDDTPINTSVVHFVESFFFTSGAYGLKAHNLSISAA